MKKRNLLIAVFMIVALASVWAGGGGQQAATTGGLMDINVVAVHWAPYPIPAENSIIFKTIEQKKNVRFNFDWRQSTDYNTQLSVLLASGTLPDLLYPGAISETVSLKDEGAIIELDGLLEKNGRNIIGAVGPNRMSGWRQVDGHIYTITGILDIEGAYSWMIRKDWLDKLNLREPSTWNEWLTVWRALRDNDVRGDRTPVVPLAFEGTQSSALSPLMWAFGIYSSPDAQFCVYNGRYMPVYEHPRYLDFLRTAANLYREGIVDQEFSTRTSNDLYTLMDSGRAASTMTWAERASISTTTNRGAGDSAALWKTLAPPKGPNGDQGIQPRDWRQTSLSVTTAAQKAGKAERIIQFFDWLYGAEGIELFSYGAAGETFDYVSGKPVLKPALYSDGFVSYRSAGLQYAPFVGIWTEDAYMQVLNRGSTYDQLPVQVQSFYDGLFTVNKGHYYNLPETLGTEALNRYRAELISNGVNVLRARAIAGQITVDEFNAQYQALKPRGFQQIIDQGAAAYAAKSSR